MSIKKAYTELHTLLSTALEAKAIKKDVFDSAVKLMSTKTGGGGSSATNYLKDSSGKPVAQLCYYYKKWMPLVGENAVEFGKKAGTATGFNTMSKEGAKLWTKQYNVAKKTKADLLVDLAKGKFPVEKLDAELARVDKARELVADTKDGFAKKEDLMSYLAKSGIKMTPAEAPAKA